MRIWAAIVALTALSNCAHVESNLGWDCRATVDSGAIRATAYFYLNASGQLQAAMTDWRVTETSGQAGVHATWEGGSPQVDWPSGKAYLVMSEEPNPRFAKHRLELHGERGSLEVGALGRGTPILLIAWPRLLELSAAQPLTLILMSETGAERRRVPLKRDQLVHGLAAADHAAGQAARRMAGLRQYCERSPEIIPT